MSKFKIGQEIEVRQDSEKCRIWEHFFYVGENAVVYFFACTNAKEPFDQVTVCSSYSKVIYTIHPFKSVEEMTVAEISKELGREIKIVK